MPATENWTTRLPIPVFWQLTPALQSFLQFVQHYLLPQQHNLAANLLIKDFLIKLLAQHFLAEFDHRVLFAKNWIDTHYATPINIHTLAKQCCLSTSQLQRRFKQALNQGIAEYWRTVRLQQASLLLKTNTLAIETIANKVGYENVAAFSRSFTRLFNMSPSAW